MSHRRPVVLVAVAVIGSVTGFLLFRLSQRQSGAVVAAAPVVVATPTALFPAVLPAVDEESAPPVRWAAVSDTTPSPRWKIAFEQSYFDSDNASDVWTANGDGSGERRILIDAQSPCWSPRRRMLAFARGGNVWVANADGTSARPLTFWPATRGKDAVDIHGIAWNGHDNVLSFGRDAIYRLANEDGGTRKAIYGTTIYHLALKPAQTARATAALPFAPVTYETPTSPRDTGNRAVWRRTPPRFDLTEHHGHFTFADNAYPAWSPSGTKLAFIREGDVWLAEGENEEHSSDGSYAQNWWVSRIAASAHYDGHTIGGRWTVSVNGISWAPDASWLMYGAQRISGSGVDDLHLLRRNKGNWNDTLLKVHGHSPCVSPDGRWILYTAGGGVYAMTPDQKKQITLTKPGKNAWYESVTW